MPKYDIVKASSYDPAALADQLTQKSADGWEVVAIVPTGGDVTAFLKKDGDGDEASPAMAEASTPKTEAPAAYTPEPVAEPAGWGVAPESSTPAAAERAPMAPIAEPVSSSPPASSSASPPTVTMYTPSTSTPAAAATPPAAAVPSVPAGWYADPSGRYEQRYWDGGTWTEHVARGGAQFTDPPVA